MDGTERVACGSYTQADQPHYLVRLTSFLGVFSVMMAYAAKTLTTFISTSTVEP